MVIVSERRTQAGAGGMAVRRPVAGGAEVLPDVSDPSQMQRFFLQEVQLGEELMAAGNVEEGAVHIANAVMLCGESQQLLSIFQQTLSEEQFRAVVQQLPSTREVSICFFINMSFSSLKLEKRPFNLSNYQFNNPDI